MLTAKPRQPFAGVLTSAATLLLGFLICLAGNPAEARQARSKSVLRQFQQQFACPSTGLKTGTCPGFQRDHWIPLECGGPDSVGNLSWLPTVVHWAKTRVDNGRCGAGHRAKSR